MSVIPTAIFTIYFHQYRTCINGHIRCSYTLKCFVCAEKQYQSHLSLSLEIMCASRIKKPVISIDIKILCA